MNYLGSKRIIAKHLKPIIEKELQEKKYYGVGYDLISRKFFHYSHGKQHYDSLNAVTMNNFFRNEDDAIELARKYNEVSL